MGNADKRYVPRPFLVVFEGDFWGSLAHVPRTYSCNINYLQIRGTAKKLTSRTTHQCSTIPNLLLLSTEKCAQNNCAESAQIIDAIYTYHRAPFALKGPTTSPTSNFRDLYTDE